MRVVTLLSALIAFAACGASDTGSESQPGVTATPVATGAASVTAGGTATAVASATAPPLVTAVTDASPTVDGVSAGYLLARAHIGPLQPIARTGTPGQTPSPAVCEARGLTILDAAGVTEVRSVSFGPECTVRVELLPGSYIVQLRATSPLESSSDVPQTVTITAGQTVVLEIHIDTGIR